MGFAVIAREGDLGTSIHGEAITVFIDYQLQCLNSFTDESTKNDSHLRRASEFVIHDASQPYTLKQQPRTVSGCEKQDRTINSSFETPKKIIPYLDEMHE